MDFYLYLYNMESKENLKSVKNYAMRNGVTPSYIYKLAKENKIVLVEIDGIKFIDITKYPVLPTKK